MAISSRLARAPRAAVVGPGTGSARAKFEWSSLWQKYRLRKSSGRQTTRAPSLAAWRINASATARLRAASLVQRIWTSPILNAASVILVRRIGDRPAEGNAMGGPRDEF